MFDKKIFPTFAFLVIVPIVLTVAGGCFISDKYFFYGYNCSAASFYFLNIVLLLGSCLTLYFNYKSLKSSLIWYFLGGIAVLVVLANLFALISLSNFGF